MEHMLNKIALQNAINVHRKHRSTFEEVMRQSSTCSVSRIYIIGKTEQVILYKHTAPEHRCTQNKQPQTKNKNKKNYKIQKKSRKSEF